MKRNFLIGRAIIVAATVLTLAALTRVVTDFANNPNDPLTTQSALEASVDGRG